MGVLADKNDFEFQRWVENYNSDFILPFITEAASKKYKIDMFSTSGMFYLWYPEKEKYIEIKTKLDLTNKENIYSLVKTFDELIKDGEI
ncbi:hypothetical protein [Pedobacter sp. UBA4863]|uniref:hypothetical protein n=1 Tax=Pedobacter sp. UBA4863 TaxID=1947060 RepID=UPI00260101BB|nr:hypothetical protein [Pedobacter sp. UBA4863]